MDRTFVLVTAAHNEEEFIAETLESVIAQKARPHRWIVVNDGSVDRTGEIIRSYASRHSFIEQIESNHPHSHEFAAQVQALNRGISPLGASRYAFICILDADVSFEPWYFSRLLDKFESDPSLGLAGGYVYEYVHGHMQSRKRNAAWSVAGATQMFRRECFESIGGLPPLNYGGEDTYMEVSARMLGWRVASFPELQVLHRRRQGAAVGCLRYLFRQGLMDFSLGMHPLFELGRCARRLSGRPLGVGGLIRFLGFVWAACCNTERPVSPKFVEFLRAEQVSRMRLLRRSRGRQWDGQAGSKGSQAKVGGL